MTLLPENGRQIELGVRLAVDTDEAKSEGRNERDDVRPDQIHLEDHSDGTCIRKRVQSKKHCFSTHHRHLNVDGIVVV